MTEEMCNSEQFSEKIWMNRNFLEDFPEKIREKIKKQQEYSLSLFPCDSQVSEN